MQLLTLENDTLKGLFVLYDAIVRRPRANVLCGLRSSIAILWRDVAWPCLQIKWLHLRGKGADAPQHDGSTVSWHLAWALWPAPRWLLPRGRPPVLPWPWVPGEWETRSITGEPNKYAGWQSDSSRTCCSRACISPRPRLLSARWKAWEITRGYGPPRLRNSRRTISSSEPHFGHCLWYIHLSWVLVCLFYLKCGNLMTTFPRVVIITENSYCVTALSILSTLIHSFLQLPVTWSPHRTAEETPTPRSPAWKPLGPASARSPGGPAWAAQSGSAAAAPRQVLRLRSGFLLFPACPNLL